MPPAAARRGRRARGAARHRHVAVAFSLSSQSILIDPVLPAFIHADRWWRMRAQTDRTFNTSSRDKTSNARPVRVFMRQQHHHHRAPKTRQRRQQRITITRAGIQRYHHPMPDHYIDIHVRQASRKVRASARATRRTHDDQISTMRRQCRGANEAAARTQRQRQRCMRARGNAPWQ